MTEQAFKKNWDEITFNQPATFTKIDVILKNPAPQHVAVSNVLAQVSNFLVASLNMKTVTRTQTDNRMLVKAAG